MVRDNYLATIWNQERVCGSKSNFHTNLWFCGRNLPTTSPILLSAMFESFLYPKWRYGPAAAAPLRSTHTTHKNLFLVLIPFFHDPQARPEMVLGSALEAAQSRAELGDDSSSSYIYLYTYLYWWHQLHPPSKQAGSCCVQGERNQKRLDTTWT